MSRTALLYLLPVAIVLSLLVGFAAGLWLRAT